uniref:Uncharacterized protein n=1 Tax=Sipha flava TaxID=143950 RepID=A0A2S2R725_9HEMI
MMRRPTWQGEQVGGRWVGDRTRSHALNAYNNNNNIIHRLYRIFTIIARVVPPRRRHYGQVRIGCSYAGAGARPRTGLCARAKGFRHATRGRRRRPSCRAYVSHGGGSVHYLIFCSFSLPLSLSL